MATSLRGGKLACAVAKTSVGTKLVAETDRNRTCQTEMLGLTGFEDRGAHQERIRLHRVMVQANKTPRSMGL